MINLGGTDGTAEPWHLQLPSPSQKNFLALMLIPRQRLRRNSSAFCAAFTKALSRPTRPSFWNITGDQRHRRMRISKYEASSSPQTEENDGVAKCTKCTTAARSSTAGGQAEEPNVGHEETLTRQGMLKGRQFHL